MHIMSVSCLECGEELYDFNIKPTKFLNYYKTIMESEILKLIVKKKSTSKSSKDTECCAFLMVDSQWVSYMDMDLSIEVWTVPPSTTLEKLRS